MGELLGISEYALWQHIKKTEVPAETDYHLQYKTKQEKII